MHLCCRPFWWPCGCVGAMLLILPNATCPGLYWKPLDATNYSLHSTPVAARATANNTMMKKCTNFAGQFDGRSSALEWYHTHCPMEEVQGFDRSNLTPPSGKYYGQQLQSTMHTLLYFKFFHRQLIEKGHWLTLRTQLTTMVWHIELMGSI